MALLFDVDCYLIQSFISSHINSHMTDRWQFRWLDWTWDTQVTSKRDYSHHHLHMLDTVRYTVKISFQYKRLVTIYILESKYPTEWCFKAYNEDNRRTVKMEKSGTFLLNLGVHLTSFLYQKWNWSKSVHSLYAVCWCCSMFWQMVNKVAWWTNPQWQLQNWYLANKSNRNEKPHVCMHPVLSYSSLHPPVEEKSGLTLMTMAAQGTNTIVGYQQLNIDDTCFV